MKQLTAIILALIILAASAKDVLMWASFKVNQGYIAKTLCINRDKPAMKCNGKCQLSKKIAESKQEKQQEAPVPQPDEQKQVVFFCEIFPTILPGSDLSAQTTVFRATAFHEQSCPADIFQPPRTSPTRAAA